MNNSLKYSGGTAISLNVEQSGKKFVMQLVDDGKGFDPGEARDANGLRNIHERARLLGERLSVDSSSGNGTTVEFTGNLR